MTSFQRRLPASVRERLVGTATFFLLMALMPGVFPTPASAGLILQVQDATVQSGGTGSLDVVIYATYGFFDVSGFQVELSVDGGSGVTFTGATVDTTAAPYIFTTFQSAPPFTIGSLPTTDLMVADGDMTAPGTVTVSSAPTSLFGIEHVRFTVAAGTPNGAVLVSILAGINGLTQSTISTANSSRSRRSMARSQSLRPRCPSHRRCSWGSSPRRACSSSNGRWFLMSHPRRPGPGANESGSRAG